MRLSVKGKHLDVGDALRTHVRTSLSHILGKYFGDAIDVAVTLSREGHRHLAALTMHIGRGIRVQARGEADAPYPAFDSAAEHLAKRLRRYKRRLRDHHKDSESEHAPLPAQQYVLSGEPLSDEDAHNGVPAPAVIAEMATEILSLSVSEAVMRLDLGDLPALLFRNGSHGGLNMIYRRADGNIGWIDPRGNMRE